MTEQTEGETLEIKEGDNVAFRYQPEWQLLKGVVTFVSSQSKFSVLKDNNHKVWVRRDQIETVNGAMLPKSA